MSSASRDSAGSTSSNPPISHRPPPWTTEYTNMFRTELSREEVEAPRPEDTLGIPPDVTRIIDIGESVKIVSAQFGWGVVTEGDIGVVIAIESVNSILHLNIPGVHSDWMCNWTDVVLNNQTPQSKQPRDKVSILTSKYMRMHKNKLYALKRERDSARTVIRDANIKIEQVLDKVRELTLFVNSDTSKLRHLNRDDRITNYIKSLLENDYEEIVIDGLGLRGTTKEVSITYRDVKVKLGKYNVMVTLSGIKVFNVTEGKLFDDTFDHPHIKRGICCFGTWATNIYTEHKNSDYLCVLGIMSRFLKEIDDRAWYVNVLLWSDDIDKRCKNCFNLTTTCNCDSPRCSTCHIVENECQCIRCPESGEVLENGETDNYCSDACRSYNEENHSCNYGGRDE